MISASRFGIGRVATCWLAALVALHTQAAAPPASLQTKVTREGRLMHVQATLGAAAAHTLCYAVLADFDRLEEFVPGLVSSDVVSAPGQPILLRQVGLAKAGPFEHTLDVTLAVHEIPPQRIEFERVAGNLLQMNGSWTVAGDAGRCDIAYVADIEPAFWVPPLIGPVLMRNRVETQLEGVLHEIERRAAAPAAP